MLECSKLNKKEGKTKKMALNAIWDESFLKSLDEEDTYMIIYQVIEYTLDMKGDTFHGDNPLNKSKESSNNEVIDSKLERL